MKLFNLSLIVQTLAFLFSHTYRRIFINLRRILQNNQAISLRELSTLCRTKNSEKEAAEQRAERLEVVRQNITAQIQL